MYNYIRKLSSSKGEEDGDNAVYADPVWQSRLNTIELKRDEQYAFSIILMKDNGKKVFPAVKPDFKNKKKESVTPNNWILLPLK